MIFHPTASGKSRTVALTVEASCRCGWYLQAPDVHPADRVAAKHGTRGDTAGVDAARAVIHEVTWGVANLSLGYLVQYGSDYDADAHRAAGLLPRA